MIKPHFLLSEFLKHLNDDEIFDFCNDITLLANLLQIVELLTELRSILSSKKVPSAKITVNSWYRNKKHNDATPNSSPTSQHLNGSAVDISFVSPAIKRTAVDIIIKQDFDFGQLIVYDNFIHLSLPRINKPNKQVIYKTT